eukprot:3572840-Amphidinium_carterae.1
MDVLIPTTSTKLANQASSTTTLKSLLCLHLFYRGKKKARQLKRQTQLRALRTTLDLVLFQTRHAAKRTCNISNTNA